MCEIKSEILFYTIKNRVRMKITKAIIAILFLWFAYVQVNDPDPWLWVALYLYVAVMAGLAFFDNYFPKMIFGGMFVCAIQMIALLPDFYTWLVNGAPSIVESMKAEQPHIELTREFLGSLICILVLWWIYRQGKLLS